MHNIVLRHLCNFQSDLLRESGTRLTPHTVITISWAILPVLYATSRGCFVTAGLYFLVPSPFPPSPQPSSPLAAIDREPMSFA